MSNKEKKKFFEFTENQALKNQKLFYRKTDGFNQKSKN